MFQIRWSNAQFFSYYMYDIMDIFFKKHEWVNLVRFILILEIACTCLERELNVWRHSTAGISNGFATQSAISLKRKADKPNVPSISLRFFRRIFGRMHTRHPSRTSNKRARSGDIEGQQRKESVWFWIKRFILPRAAKCESLSEANTIRETNSRLLIVQCQSLFVVNC